LFVYYPELGEALYFVDDEGGVGYYPSSYSTNLGGFGLTGKYQKEPFDWYNALLTVPDFYGEVIRDNDNYTTTKGEVKSILKPNGEVRSLQAAKALSRSKIFKYLGVAGDVYTLSNAIFSDKKLSIKDWFDVGISAVSLGTTIVVGAELFVISTPVIEAIGITGAVWGAASLGLDIIEQYKK
jgi:hypothetical protein